VLDVDAVGFGAVVEEYSMSQYGRGEGADVVDRGVGAALPKRAGFGTDDEGLGGAGAGAPVDPVVDEGGGVFGAGTRGGGEADGEADDVLGDGDVANKVLEGENVFAGEDRFEGGRGAGGGLLDDGDLVGPRGGSR